MTTPRNDDDLFGGPLDDPLDVQLPPIPTLPAPDDDDVQVSTTPRLLYTYSPLTGLEWMRATGGGSKTGTGRTPVANFKVQLSRQINVINDGEEDRFYELTITRPASPDIVIALSGEDLEHSRMLQKHLSAKLPTTHIVYPDGWKHLSAAAREFSASPTVEVRYGQMGWAENGIYILPGMQEAITDKGLSSLHLLHDLSLKKLPPRLLQYGVGVRPPTAAEHMVAEKAFASVLAVSNEISAIAVQVLAAPLVGIVGRNAPPLLHVRGRTGSLKTSLCLLGLNFMGKFDKATETWASTQNSLMRRLWEAKDVTLLIDDYKKAVRGGEPIQLVQAYADGTTRGRMSQDQENRQSLLPKGLLLSTGEDLWEEHESAEARTITLPIVLPEEPERTPYLAQLRVAQAAALRGELALFGGAWIQWLAKQDPNVLVKVYLDASDKYLKAFAANFPTLHARSQETLAGYFALGKIIEQFMVQEFPALLSAYTTCWNGAKRIIVDAAGERAEEAASTAPYDSLISDLKQAFDSGMVRFTPRRTSAPVPDLVTPGYARPDPVGFFDDDNIYLTKALTYQWAESRARSAGRQLQYSWAAFSHGTRTALGAKLPDGHDRGSYVFKSAGVGIRSVVIPRSSIDTGSPLSSVEQEISDILSSMPDLPDAQDTPQS